MSAIVGAAAGALVAVTGWFVVHALSVRRELTARRDAAARAHVEAQIERLYGPLLGLIQHSRLARDVAARILPKRDDGSIAPERFSERDAMIWQFFIENYFLPINAQIRQLIRANMHLLERGVQPESMGIFFLHEVQFEALHRLWKAQGVDSSGIVSGPVWPGKFEHDIQTTLDELLGRHQWFLSRVGASRGTVAKAVNVSTMREATASPSAG